MAAANISRFATVKPCDTSWAWTPASIHQRSDNTVFQVPPVPLAMANEAIISSPEMTGTAQLPRNQVEILFTVFAPSASFDSLREARRRHLGLPGGCESADGCAGYPALATACTSS